MRVRGVDFVGIAVPDMAIAQAFYRDALGLQPLSEGEHWSEYEAGNVTVSLYLMAQAAASEPSMRNAVLALAVEDVPAALQELRAKGSKVLQETEEYPPCFMATVTDPFGNSIMLHQRKDGSAG
ncbi:MAG: VOC family protein [Thermaerobacter sp.]|nr:VOC family protein [Thermaerobacter sp.]